MKPKIESDLYLSVVTDVFWHPGQNLLDKKTFPGQKLLRTKTNPPVKTYVCMYACTTKNWGFRDVWQGEGVKIGPK